MFAVHSFANLMVKIFRHSVILIILFLVSSNSLLSNTLYPSFLIPVAQKTEVKSFCKTQLHGTDANFYTEYFPLKDEFIKKGFISDNEEDVEHLNSKKVFSQVKLTLCRFKHQLPSFSSLPENTKTSTIPIFFQSKTATSLYLLFEVFRL
jgi:hypothetical protein